MEPGAGEERVVEEHNILVVGDYRLVVAPSRGGSLLAFTWRGQPLLRTAQGQGILDAACFPLVPFCNRIAHGRFEWRGRRVLIAPNFPGSDHPHPLHGFGWLSPWRVAHFDAQRIVLAHEHDGGEWPWRYRAELEYALDDEGLRAALSLTNLSDQPMPAGIGFHPYFPRTAATRYHGLHRGEWQNDADCLPQRLVEYADARDWWNGAPVGTRIVDTVYSGSHPEHRIDWPDRGLAVRMHCSPVFASSTILVPEEDWFCVEPVSHHTNAVNLRGVAVGPVELTPGESLAGSFTLGVIGRGS